MAVTYRSAARGSGIGLGKQSDQETPVTSRGNSGTPTHKMIPVLFPVSASSLGPDDETEESNLITAYGAAAAPERGQEWVSGGWVTRILPEYIHHLLEGILNPTGMASNKLVGGVLVAVQNGNPLTTPITTFANSGRPPVGINADTNQENAPSGWPSKVKLTLTGTPTYPSGKMVIKGLRRGGRKVGTTDRLATFFQEETVAITGLETTSAKMWDTVTSITITGVTGAGSYKLDWQPDTYKTTMQFQLTDPEHPGFTILNLVGGRPDRLWGYIMSEMSISAGSDGIDVTFAGTGIRYDRERTISTADDFDAEKVALEAADTSYYTRPDLKSFPGWAGALAFGNITQEENIVKYSSIDMNINRNYGPAPGIDGRAFRTGVSQDGNRLTTFSPTALMRGRSALSDTLQNYLDLYRSDAKEKLTMRNLSYDQNGRQKQIDWICPSSKITSIPRNEFTGPGQIEEPLVFQAEPVGSTPELQIVMYTATQLYAP